MARCTVCGAKAGFLMSVCQACIQTAEARALAAFTQRQRETWVPRQGPLFDEHFYGGVFSSIALWTGLLAMVVITCISPLMLLPMALSGGGGLALFSCLCPLQVMICLGFVVLFKRSISLAEIAKMQDEENARLWEAIHAARRERMNVKESVEPQPVEPAKLARENSRHQESFSPAPSSKFGRREDPKPQPPAGSSE